MSEGRYNLYSQGSSGWTTMRNEEFQEEDIWGNFINKQDFGTTNSKDSSSNFTPRKLPTASKMIPRSKKNNEPKVVHSSAPVKVPDWSKIYGTSSKKAKWHDGNNDDVGGGECDFLRSWGSDDDDAEETNEGETMPPHEWLAKKLERTQISSFSVCEGVGRTLKGRDLSRVRNAILSKTGFLE